MAIWDHILRKMWPFSSVVQLAEPEQRASRRKHKQVDRMLKPEPAFPFGDR
jgi:hypothetical protein